MGRKVIIVEEPNELEQELVGGLFLFGMLSLFVVGVVGTIYKALK